MATMGKKGQRVTLSLIQDTYFGGDFEACLAMCDVLSSKDATDAAQIAFLRARCLISLGRGDHALEVLRGLQIRLDQHDEYITGRMLISAAYIALGNYNEGAKVAREAREEIGEAHPTIQSELTLTLATAHYRKGEYAETSRLLEGIPETQDIVYVRALQFLGGVACALGNFTASLEKFQKALALLGQCRHHDRFTEAKLLFALIYLCGEMPCLDLWPDLLKRIDEFDWSVTGVAEWRYRIAIEASFITELLGELSASTYWARVAEEGAYDTTSLIVAWCRLAARFGRNGEKGGHEYFTDKAIEKYDVFLKDVRLREQWALSLDVAEEILYSDSPSAAAHLVTYYSEVIAPNVRSIKAEGRVIESRYATVLGLLEERRGNRARAEEAYRRAFETICSTGLMRGAAIVAYHLFSLTGEKQYADFTTKVLRDASDKYWVKARLAQCQLPARLTPRQLQAVQLVAKGLTDKEIGSALGVKYSRARNIVAAAREALGVHSRTELITVAASRGLLTE